MKNATLVSFARRLIGAKIVFGTNMLKDYQPVVLQEPDPFKLFNFDNEMIVLNDKSWNIEAKAHLLDDKITPNSKMFVRNNGKTHVDIDAKDWTLTIDGESAKEKKVFTINDLKTKFKEHSYQLRLECGGNGRSEFNPPVKWNQWTIGAVSCAI